MNERLVLGEQLAVSRRPGGPRQPALAFASRLAREKPLGAPLLVLLRGAAVGGLGIRPVVVGLSLTGSSDSRIIGGTVLSLRSSPFVEAAQAAGATVPRLLLRPIAPNAFAPVIILVTIN